MATIKQIEANRRNAQRSTGPVTAAGKAAVRFNALQSGIDAASILIPGEDPQQFKTLAAELTAAWRPADARERELVDQIIDNSWRLRRLRAAEAQLWTRAIESRRSSSHPRPHTELGDAFDANSTTLLRIQRLVASLQRSSHQATADLQRLQAARAQAAAEPEPLPAPPAESPEQSQFAAPPPPTAPAIEAWPIPESLPETLDPLPPNV